jgi:hypothetical protein
VPEPDRPAGLVTRGLVVGVVGAGVSAVAVVAPPVSAVLFAVVVVVWSDSNVAAALARFAFAAVTALCNGRGLMVDRAWPVVTVSPTDTSTLVTVPATAKLSLTWSTLWTDPVTLRRCSTEPVVTVLVRYVSIGLALALARVTTVPATTRTAATPAGSVRRTHVRRRRRCRTSGTGAPARRSRAAGAAPAESSAES